MTDKTAKVIPIIDCPVCKAKDVPLSHINTLSKKGHPDVVIWECTNCGKVPNVAQNLKIKKYISVEELETMGWKQTK
jgi:uncharacterized Zn finger protein